MAHPYVDLLRDRDVRILWGGLSLSALGSELYRVGAIWLAAEMAGPKAALMVTAQSAAVLAVSLFAGPAVEALPRRWALAGAELTAAVASVAVVVVAVSIGLSFPVLVVASVLLAALAAMSRPVLLSSVPGLAPAGKLREANGLLDSTLRVAQAAGPFLAAAAMGVMPAIHLLTANAVSFLASAGALLAVGRRLDGAPAPAARRGLLRRLGRGIAAANGCPGVWHALIATGARGGAYTLGFSVAIPVMYAQAGGAGGLRAVAIVFGAGAAGELLTTPILVLTHPQRPLRRQFEGYAAVGLCLALVGAAAALPAPWQVAAMAAAAFALGVGHAVAGLQMMTFFSARLSSDDYAAVLRVRLVLVISSMILASAVGPVVLPALGPATTTVACGLVAIAAALPGLFSRPARRLGPGFVEADGTGEAAAKLVS